MQSLYHVDPHQLIPDPAELRGRLASALREVQILRGLIRLAEQVARADGRPDAVDRKAVTHDHR